MFENIKSDLGRLSPSGKPSPRTLIAGLLSQGFQAILVYRFFNWLQRKGLPGQPLRFILERFIEITCGISIPACCQIGKGFRIHHFGGIIFHPSAKLGENCTFYHGVTIGDSGGSGAAATIGNNVLAGAGAKIIGEITIGDNVTIGANTVVTKDVPENTVVVGSPARFLPKKKIVAEPEVEEIVSPAPVRVMDFRGTYKGGGGPDKTILNSAVQHDKSRVYIQVLYLRNPADDEYSIDKWAADLGANYMEVFDRKLLDWRCVAEIKKIIEEQNISIVHSHDEKTLLYGWLLKRKIPQLKIMYTCHLHSPYIRADFDSLSGYLNFKLRRKVNIFLMKRYDKPLLAVSHHTKKSMINDGLHENDIETLHNGIDIDVWRAELGKPALRDELGVTADEFLVGTVARIAAQHKDLPTFYKVAAEISKKLDKVKFVIVGDGHGDEMKKAKERVAELGMENNFFFTGHRTDLLDIYTSFDVFLMTSLTEGLPNTVLEAMALKIPVVSTIVAGVPELVEHGKTGLLSPIRDVEGLSKQVIDLLTDSELRSQFAQQARERIETDFSFSGRVRRMEGYYEFFND